MIVRACLWLSVSDVHQVGASVLTVYACFRGGYGKPHWTDVLWVQLIISPYTLAMYVIWYARWIWKFNICKEEYGEEEKLYLIKKYLGVSKTQWEVSKWLAGVRHQ